MVSCNFLPSDILKFALYFQGRKLLILSGHRADSKPSGSFFRELVKIYGRRDLWSAGEFFFKKILYAMQCRLALSEIIASTLCGLTLPAESIVISVPGKLLQELC